MVDEITVRVGTLDDLDGMMDLALRASHENGFVNPSPQKLLEAIYPSLELKGGVVGIIGQPGERIEGAILLRLGPTWYSEDCILDERAVFVDPEFRAAKGGRARRLIEFAKEYSSQLGIPLSVGVLSSHRTKGKIALYERELGPASGIYFLWGAKTGMHQEAAE